MFRCRRRRRRTRSRLRRLSRRATRTAGTRVRRRARRTAARLVGSEGPVPAVQQKPPEGEHEEHHEVRGHEARGEVKRLFFNATRVVYQSVVVVFFFFYRRRRRMRTRGGDGRGGEKRKAKREKQKRKATRTSKRTSKRVRDEIDRDGRFRARERETKQKTRRAFPETRTHAAAISGLVSIHRTHTHGFLLPHPNASVRASPTRRRNASSFSSSSSPPRRRRSIRRRSRLMSSADAPLRARNAKRARLARRRASTRRSRRLRRFSMVSRQISHVRSAEAFLATYCDAHEMCMYPPVHAHPRCTAPDARTPSRWIGASAASAREKDATSSRRIGSMQMRQKSTSSSSSSSVFPSTSSSSMPTTRTTRVPGVFSPRTGPGVSSPSSSSPPSDGPPRAGVCDEAEDASSSSDELGDDASLPRVSPGFRIARSTTISLSSTSPAEFETRRSRGAEPSSPARARRGSSSPASPRATRARSMDMRARRSRARQWCASARVDGSHGPCDMEVEPRTGRSRHADESDDARREKRPRKNAFCCTAFNKLR